MREAKSRIQAWEKRTTLMISQDMMYIVNAMLWGKLDNLVAKDVLNYAGKESGVEKNFDLMKKSVGAVKQFESRNKPTSMDLSALTAFDHAEYVRYQTEGEEWQEEWPEEYPPLQDEWERQRLAAVSQAEAHLDALRKGKGKGKKGKGKGKDGKGPQGWQNAGKGPGSPQTPAANGATAPPGPTGATRGQRETRQCYNCLEYGHIGKDCPQPD